MSTTPRTTGTARTGFDLFLVSLLLLFLELACIRWFPSHVLFLTFFTNTVLLASFLGMSLGCLAAGSQRNYLPWTGPLLCLALVGGLGMEYIRASLEEVVDVGGQTSPQLVYFGTEYKGSDLATFAIPVEVIAGVFFVLLALVHVGPGQAMGRLFAAMPHRLHAYSLNLLGSLVGIVLFSAFSWMQLPPVGWFLPVAVGLVYLLVTRPGWRPTLASLGALLAVALVPILALVPASSADNKPDETLWSPYYRIDYTHPPAGVIHVNLIGHQEMLGRDKPFVAYALPHLLNRDAGRHPFKDVLVIGAGSGNDVSRALQWGPPDVRVDAVEIDPVIAALGKRDHPDRPYDDPRVTVHLNDGRNFLKATPRKYDLILFALVDSLVLHSSYSNIRLESYLFTQQAMEDVRDRLKPDGVFAVYNFFRQGWIVARLTQTLEEVFGEPPVVLSLPRQEVVQPDDKFDGFTLILAGPGAKAIRDAFADHPRYRLPRGVAPDPSFPNGFTAPSKEALEFSVARVVRPDPPLRIATDDWPFLYLREPMLPDLSIRGVVVLGVLSLVLLFLFVPRGSAAGARGFDGRMFFLGAGFLLIETRAVVHMALLFGSTWIVNSVVFFAVLCMSLGASLFVARFPPRRLALAYVGLLATLALNVAVPLDVFLGLSRPMQVVGSCLLVFTPVLFAGVIFAESFRCTRAPDRAFGFNIAGAMVGGLAEYTSMLLGFRYLGLVAVAFYLLSACWPTPRETSQTT